MRARVEVIPGMQMDFGIDFIPLDGSEIWDYFEGRVGMMRYVIDERYLSF